jgi:hypothetical protein
MIVVKHIERAELKNAVLNFLTNSVVDVRQTEVVPAANAKSRVR